MPFNHLPLFPGFLPSMGLWHLVLQGPSGAYKVTEMGVSRQYAEDDKVANAWALDNIVEQLH